MERITRDKPALPAGTLPVVPPVLGEGNHAVGEVPNVPRAGSSRTAWAGSSGTEGAVELAEPEPRLWRELEGPACAVGVCIEKEASPVSERSRRERW
jgi:hypothetical protein